MIYVRLFFILLWLLLSCALGLVGCLFFWGNLDIDHHFGRFFGWGVTRIAGIRVVQEGLEHLEAHQPCIYVANHQSGMDMATFGTLYPRRTVLVGKRELLYIPFFGLFFKAAGNIIINRQKRVSAIAGLGDGVQRILAERLSVWVFPEGTRNVTDGEMLPFKKGAFYMAMQAGVPVVPILCSPITPILNWKERHHRSGTVVVRVLPPIPSTAYGEAGAGGVDQLARDVRARMEEGLAQVGLAAVRGGSRGTD